MALVDDAELRVRSTGITLPVGVVGDVAGGNGDGIIVGLGVQGAGGRVSEVRIQRDTVGAVGVDGEGLSDGLPEAGGLKSLFLRARGQHHLPSSNLDSSSWMKPRARIERNWRQLRLQGAVNEGVFRTFEMETRPPAAFAAT